MAFRRFTRVLTNTDASEQATQIEAARAARARAWSLVPELLRVRRLTREVREQVAERREQTRRLLSPQ